MFNLNEPMVTMKRQQNVTKKRLFRRPEVLYKIYGLIFFLFKDVLSNILVATEPVIK